MLRIILLFIMLPLLGGCATNKGPQINPYEVVVDGSSAKSAKRDLTIIMKNLSRHKRTRFIDDLYRVQHIDTKTVEQVMENIKNPGPIDFKKLKDKVDGLNYAQITELAESSPLTIERL